MRGLADGGWSARGFPGMGRIGGIGRIGDMCRMCHVSRLGTADEFQGVSSPERCPTVAGAFNSRRETRAQRFVAERRLKRETRATLRDGSHLTRKPGLERPACLACRAQIPRRSLLSNKHTIRNDSNSARRQLVHGRLVSLSRHSYRSPRPGLPPCGGRACSR